MQKLLYFVSLHYSAVRTVQTTGQKKNLSSYTLSFTGLQSGQRGSYAHISDTWHEDVRGCCAIWRWMVNFLLLSTGLSENSPWHTLGRRQGRSQETVWTVWNVVTRIKILAWAGNWTPVFHLTAILAHFKGKKWDENILDWKISLNILFP